MTNSLILTTIHNFQDSEQLQETEHDMQCPSDTTNAIYMSCKATGWLVGMRLLLEDMCIEHSV